MSRPESTIRLTSGERDRIADAEGRLAQSVRAHEAMREIYYPGEWTGSTRAFRDPDNWIHEVRRLQPDINELVDTVLDILADACWRLGSLEAFRHEFERNAPGVLDRAIAQVPEQDRPLLDHDFLATAYRRRVKYWLDKASEELRPKWMSSEDEGPIVEPSDHRETASSPNQGADLSDESPSGSSKTPLADSATRARRRDILKRYRTVNSLSDMSDLAHHLGMSKSAIEGIVRSDTTRYSQQKLADFLKRIGVNPEDW